MVARGGGSIEDLAGFNDEALARTIAASELPVVSAIGHETDFTIADFVADLRAPTPSAAAELSTAAQHRIEERIQALDTRVRRAIRYQLMLARQQFSAVSVGDSEPVTGVDWAARAAVWTTPAVPAGVCDGAEGAGWANRLAEADGAGGAGRIRRCGWGWRSGGWSGPSRCWEG